MIHKRKTFKTVTNLSLNTKPEPMQCSVKLQKNLTKNWRATHQTLQASASMLKVKVHHSTIKKTEQAWHVWKGCQEKTWAQVCNKWQNFLINVLRTAESKVEMFGYNVQHHIWKKPHKHIRTNTSNQPSRMVVEGFDLIWFVMISGLFTTTRPGDLI